MSVEDFVSKRICSKIYTIEIKKKNDYLIRS